MISRFSSRMQCGRVFLPVLFLLIFAPVAQGQADGSGPNAGLTIGTDGNFYGTTWYGGKNGTGTVFKITPTGKLTTLYSFGNYGTPEGTYPSAGLTLGKDGNFYGTTNSGGKNGFGTVFQITSAGSLTTLYSFDLSNVGVLDNNSIEVGLTQGTDGNFYGIANGGGKNGDGMIYRITPAGKLTILHSFIYSDGAYPLAGMTLGKDGNFYGTTYLGGENGAGTVFQITSKGKLTTLYSFSGEDGANPDGRLMQGTDGNFYGTTWYGGKKGSGTVFKITPVGNLTTLHSF